MTCLTITMRLQIRGFIKLEDVLLIERTETQTEAETVTKAVAVVWEAVR